MKNITSTYPDTVELLTKEQILAFNILLPIIVLSGIFVNLFVISIILSDRKMRASGESLYIVNLACADLLVCTLGIPLWIYQLNYRDPNMISCQITTGMSFVSSGISVITLSIISVTRYINVAKPFYSMKVNSKRMVVSVIIFGWIYSLIFSLPYFLGWQSNDFEITDESIALCVYTRVFSREVSLVNIFTGCLLMNANYVCYFNLLLVARQHETKIRQDLKVSETIAKKYNNKIMKDKPYKATFTLGVILGSITICWLPFLSVCIVDVFTAQIPVFTVKMFGSVTYVNSVLNPVIYTFMTKGFREAFLKRWTCVQRNFSKIEPKLVSVNLKIKETNY